MWEDPPLFASEVRPACGQSIRQAVGPLFAMWSKWLGDQWSIGDWPGMLAAAPRELPQWMAALRLAGCGHERMLAAVKVPVLFTHHFRMVDPATGVHSMHGTDPELYARTVIEWAAALPALNGPA